MFDIRRDELENSGFDEEVIDDLIFLVKADTVHVYCNPVNYPYILPYIAHWPNLRLHCMTETQYEDEDAAQEFKILSFLDMVKESQVIGVPFSARGHMQPFNPMVLEKWPLVQAHGLEDFAMGGFFTMVHQVLDLSEALTAVYDRIDAVVMETLVTEQLPLFERQWNAMISNVDIACKEKSFQKLSQATVAEPLKSYYNHGRVSSPRFSQGSTMKTPFVLFGQQSSTQKLQNDDQVLIASSGVNATPAKHMVCQAISPRSPLACARTYFLSGGHTPLPVTGATVQAPRPPKTDQELLSRLYVVVIDAVLMAIQAYVESNSFTEAYTVAMDTLKTECKEKLLPASLCSSRDVVEFTMECLDHHGNSIPIDTAQSTSFIKSIGLRVKNIGSLEHSGNNLGCVVFAESFLDSRLIVANPDERKSFDTQHLIITSRIPRYITWAGDIQKEAQSEVVKAFTKGSLPFGKVLVDGETALILGSSKLSAVHEGTMYICERGIIFNQARHGVVVFPKSHFEDLQFYDGESSGSTGILVVTYRRSLCHYLPTECHNAEDMVMFAFSPRTKIRKAFYSDVLSPWQNSNEAPPLKLVDKVPDYYAAIYNELQLKYDTDYKLKAASKPLHTAMAHLPELERFVDHFSASSVCQSPIPYTDLPAVLRQSGSPEAAPETNGESSQSNTEVVITIVTGVPGSHKDNLCKILTNMAKEQSRWVTLKPPLDSTEGFTAESVQSSLTKVIAATKKKGIRAAIGGRKKMRVLVVVPGYADTVQVVHAITSHPDPDVAKQIRIGAVTACVDPRNTFMVNRMTQPRLLDQCMQGWVNNVLFTSSASGPDRDLQVTQELIRRVNPQVAFILANNGEITRSGDIEMILSETAFMTPDLVRARHLITPGWWLGAISSLSMYPSLHEVCIKFYQPLEKNKLMAKLRNLKTSLCARPMKGNIYCIRGRTKFTDSDQLMEVQYVTLSQHLNLTAALESPSARPPAPTSPKHPQPPGSAATNGNSVMNGPNGDNNGVGYCFVFTGCELKETDLKEWLRACAKQKPVKKELRTKAALSKQELQKLQTKHHLEPLPQGWFYNGHQYVSLGGDRSNQHPEMDKFISDYLETVNAAVKLYNNKVDNEEFVDLFQNVH
ncbi:dynein axonemal assembly factor 9-like [Amphiura filiformis]|uniref:dynein axonemal assembly factor 9-like n=1 Tax=Amphiura filiformis TaxID=82378 RepID=UPI003B20FD23